MDLLNCNVKKAYFKYLAGAFASALISSVYALVDMAVVGQYHGAIGTASLAVVQPLWNIIYSLGLLTGIGGSVIFAAMRGSGEDKNKSNEYFTAAVVLSAVIGAVVWAAFLLFEEQILIFFGADKELLPYSVEYLKPIKFVFPVFLINQMLAAFLRNDNNLKLASFSVIVSSILNMIADYVFVFTFDMGTYGAGLATAFGALISLVIMLTHFVSPKNTLRLVRINKILKKFKEITFSGFSVFFVDVAMGILTVLFNRQIMHYLGSDALAVYGIIINVSTFVQCCAYSIGQASQPIMSINFGARNWGRIKQTLKYAIITSAVMSVFWTALSLAVPDMYVYIFMKPTESVLLIAPAIIRIYSISFILLPFNVFMTYYMQSIMKPGASFIISVMRGFVISGAMIMILPIIAGKDSIWLAMPITELFVAVCAGIMLKSSLKNAEKKH